ncbi:class I SAM-dependent DNA methyltransferase [Butyrivibrio sp. XBB1001]|uniref:class I SAM-dependent DNA methyltransferase n=1 Tax=Butyrivibrio sp. XBB1001 TaxID=1280682 RepID=UPI0004246C5D|nr:class I SAM-dependent methyltransferase [Butyrivibrio sp. XBB1001]
MKTFDDYAYYYNAFYGDKDYSSEADVVTGFINKYRPSVKSILDMGCGTGRHDFELAKRGYEASGIDLSENMIQIANANRHANTNFSVADVRSYRGDTLFDAAISMFHVMSYQTTDDDLIKAFETAKTNLKANGLFIFDAWYGPGVLTDKPAVRVKKVEDDNNLIIRTATPEFHVDRNIVDVNYDVYVINKRTNEAKEIKETHSMRYLFRPEVERMLSSVGFKLLECSDCNTLKNTSFDSWTAYFVAAL